MAIDPCHFISEAEGGYVELYKAKLFLYEEISTLIFSGEILL